MISSAVYPFQIAVSECCILTCSIFSKFIGRFIKFVNFHCSLCCFCFTDHVFILCYEKGGLYMKFVNVYFFFFFGARILGENLFLMWLLLVACCSWSPPLRWLERKRSFKNFNRTILCYWWLLFWNISCDIFIIFKTSLNSLKKKDCWSKKYKVLNVCPVTRIVSSTSTYLCCCFDDDWSEEDERVREREEKFFFVFVFFYDNEFVYWFSSSAHLLLVQSVVWLLVCF